MNSCEQGRWVNCCNKRTTTPSPSHGASAILLKMNDNERDVLLEHFTRFSTSD